MNQPTEDNIRQIKERQSEFEKRLRDVERHTTPIKITQLEIDSGGIFRRLDEVQEVTNSVETKIDRARGDISQIRDSQADLRDRLISHSEDLKAIKDKQDAHQALIGQLIGIGEEHTKSFTEIKATQDEHSKRFDRLEATQQSQQQLLQAILDRLPPKQ